MITAGDQWRVNTAKENLSEAKNSTDESDRLLILEKAALLNPNEETFLSAGVQAMKLGDSRLAERYLGRVKTAEGYYQLGNAYYGLDEYRLAIDCYLEALGKGKAGDMYAVLGKSYLKVGDIEKAKTYLAKTEKTEEVTSLLLLLGADIDLAGVSPSSASLRAGKHETNPANKAVLVYDGLIKLGYPQSAESILQQAEANGYLTRDSLIALANRAYVKNDYQLAYDYLQRAKSMDPYYPQIYQQLVIVCEKLDKVDEAKQNQDIYLQLVF
jgi:tetratricopeptide (TPR) repeat protein